VEEGVVFEHFVSARPFPEVHKGKGAVLEIPLGVRRQTPRVQGNYILEPLQLSATVGQKQCKTCEELRVFFAQFGEQTDQLARLRRLRVETRVITRAEHFQGDFLKI